MREKAHSASEHLSLRTPLSTDYDQDALRHPQWTAQPANKGRRIPSTSIPLMSGASLTPIHDNYRDDVDDGIIVDSLKDAKDPRNWTKVRRGLIFYIILVVSALPDNGVRLTATLAPSIARHLDVSKAAAQGVLAANQFMIAVGGLAAVMLSRHFGRMPVLFWFMLGAVGTSVGQAGAGSFAGFAVAQVFNGFFTGVAQGNGLLFITDMFSERWQDLMITLWSFSIIISPYLGPVIGGLLDSLIWRWPLGLYAVVTIFEWLGVVIVGRETWYYRGNDQDEQQRLLKSRSLQLIGVAQWRSRKLRPSLLQAFMRSFKTIANPIILMVNVYYCITLAWIVPMSSIILQPIFFYQDCLNRGNVEDTWDENEAHRIECLSSYHAVPGDKSVYSFSPEASGAFYFTPIIAAILALLVGISLHLRHVRQTRSSSRGGADVWSSPERKLRPLFFAQPVLIAGLVLFGIFVEANKHYMLVAMAWGFYVFGTLIVTASVANYLNKAFPPLAGECGAWLSVSRSVGAFVLGFVVEGTVKGPGDGQGQGAERMFGVMAGISGVAFVIIMFVMVFGGRLREMVSRNSAGEMTGNEDP
ncbi:uncharacterized protein KY384_000005 [Bacidia gigantensis]|uniref:uncharacterized protein n=1 Tax=Bacidia gigantensis TaxID=2732470 RepID=UPI001D03C72C|nr:uncharacterized protein KY384_000005 [Bacidia gigantensis]KAG8526412.1 hypothetical protein KY384_000005 [Bacidia gigantensis]